MMLRSLARAPSRTGRRAALPGPTLRRSFCFSASRWHPAGNATAPPPIFKAQGTSVYPFGVPSNDPEHALFRDLEWTVADSDCWAILAPSSSSSTRAALLATLRHQVRFDPVGSAGHPILKVLPPVERHAEEGGPRDRTVEDILKLVSFKTRLGHSGDFDDYTARYYSIRDEDKVTVRQHLEEATGAKQETIERRAEQLEMTRFLDLPLITLSNGQTRRARILRALLAEPELLILEEPFTGLDPPSRKLLSTLLASLHSARSPRVLLILRPQDELPPFVTHLALTDVTTQSSNNRLLLGPREDVLSTSEAKALLEAGEAERAAVEAKRTARRERALQREQEEEASAQGAGPRKALIELKGVNVSYGRPSEGQEERRVLKDVDWTVKEGERWLLAGHNGSGKSTLLAIILGDHPRSFTEDVSLFGKPRDRQATATLQQEIGHVSPEIFNAFPRRYGPDALTAYEAIATGFESVFSYRRATPAQSETISSLLSRLGHPRLTPSLLSQPFAALSAGDQALILLLRALVKQPPLLVLDEPFSGMDQETVALVQRYLDEELDPRQAVVLITHYEEEIPHSIGRVLRLENGAVIERT
ncbi:hypothetical protein JCM10908_001503 [Rhodotorula pacifica]|uniref:uncharacterized protein n=1 Tax=Rhodotorula pacifica TaxID=1495444 RepID=UPI00317ABD0D